MEKPTIKIKYSELAKLNPMLIEKLSKTPTSVTRAAHIRELMSQIYKVKETMSDEYQKIAKEHGVLDENGEFIRTPDKHGFQVKEGHEKQVEEAIAAFDEVEVTLEGRPWTPDTLNDIKFAAVEIEMLGQLYTNMNGPGLPQALNIAR